jgi:hypothetical protein
MSTLQLDRRVQDLAGLDAADLLGLAEEALRRRRAAEIEDLLIVAAWADVHSGDPRRDPDSGRRVWAEDRLLQVGGDGTPGVREFCIAELAMARQVHPMACESAIADVLDLRHRLPQVWASVLALECEVWLARKVARLSRRLPLDRVGIVDTAVAAAIGGESPGRVLRICEAKVIEADPIAHAARAEAERQRRYVALSRTDSAGLRHVIARVHAGDAVWVDAMVQRVADLIADRHPGTTHDELRSEAFGWLGRPAELLQLLLEARPVSADTSRTTAFPADLLDALRSVDPAQLRPRAQLFVHLSDLALAGISAPVARVEGVGPLLADHHLVRGCTVTVTPVIDLNDRVSVNSYEHPSWMRDRRLLSMPADYFPYAVAVPGLADRVDLDHPTPYDEDGPPGQTGLHNSGPLGRRHHRWKTHAGYRARQSGTTRWAWRTPHGRHYLVDQTGTRRIDDEEGAMIMDAPHGVELYFAELTYQP